MTWPIRHRLFSGFVFFLFAFNTFCQDYLAHVKHYGVEEGLSHRAVSAIYQDSRGFIWLGTKYGLNRFDGTSFKWYTKEKNGLATNTVSYILEDDGGYLWLFGQENRYTSRPDEGHPVISILNIHTEEIITLEERIGEALPFDAEHLRVASVSPNRTLYFNDHQNNLYRFNSKQGVTKVFQLETDLYDPQFYSPQHTIWGVAYGKSASLLEIDTNGVVLREVPLTFGPVEITIHQQDNINRLWLEVADSMELGLKELYTLDEEGAIEQQALTGLKHKHLTLDWRGRFWYQSATDLFWFTGKPNFYAVEARGNDRLHDFSSVFPALADAEVILMFFDRENIAWAATENGLYKIQLRRNLFTRYLFHSPEEFQINNAYSSRGIALLDNELFVNCINTYGRKIINLSTLETKSLPLEYHLEGYPRAAFYFPKAILLDRDRKVWFGEVDLIRYDPVTKTEKLFIWADQKPVQEIWSIYQDVNHKIWFGTGLGLAVLDTLTDRIYPFVDYNDYPELKEFTVYDFLEKNNKELFLSTTGGLFLLDIKEGIKARYWTGGEAGYQLPNDNVFHVHKDQEGEYWLATGGGGLVQLNFDKQNKIRRTEQYTIADGLSNNNLYAIYEDRGGMLWISSDYGIIQFDKATAQSRAYLPQDGVSYHEFNRIAHFQAEDGQIFFGSLNGVTSFYPEEVTQEAATYQAPLEIIRFQQFDKATSKIVDKMNQLKASGKITLKPGERFFELHFALLDYRDSENIRYAYKIEGLDENWTMTKQGNLRISGLPYGHYELLIKGQGPDGRFSADQMQIPVHIVAPLYAMTWFQFLMVFLTVAAFVTFLRWRTANLKKRQVELENQVRVRTIKIEADKELIAKKNNQLGRQARELRQLDEVKSRFFANVSHELRTPLTLILGPISAILRKGDVSKRNSTLLKLAQNNGTQLLKLVNSILDLSRLESGKLELKEEAVVLYPLLHRIISQFESKAELQEIMLLLDYQLDPYLRLQVDVDKLEIILNNLLSNALKFTPKGGCISMVGKDLGNKVSLEVADTGSGIHPDDLPFIFDRFYQTKQQNAPTEGGTGIGLALSRQLAQLFDGELSVESELARGTTFFLTFPKKEILGYVEEKAPAENNFFEHIPMVEAEETRLPSKSNKGAATTAGILVVEDNPSLRKYLQLILGDKYQLLMAENGQVALDILRRETAGKHIQLIVSDVMMPVMDGFQLVKELKNSDQFRHLPVVMLTARAGLDDKLKALRIGVDDYILKPFEAEELEVRIANVLHNSRQRAGMQHAAETEDTVSSRPIISEADMEWLRQLEELVKKQVSNTQFNISQLAHEMLSSERQLHRRIKALTGLTPNKYIREIKLQTARTLLEKGTYRTVEEVCYAIGFSKPEYFTSLFRKRFGKNPSSF